MTKMKWPTKKTLDMTCYQISFGTCFYSYLYDVCVLWLYAVCSLCHSLANARSELCRDMYIKLEKSVCCVTCC